MPYHLMNLRNVPEDEANEVRELFECHEVRYYETPPSRWGISMGGFWVRDAEEAARARSLLDAYQRDRFQRQRADFDKADRAGEIPGFWQRLRRKPLSMVAVFVAIGLILLVTLAPFLSL
ncbi:MAG: hypothetical protein KGY54_11205 [Oleiphilaceae bacterium]|nr:hypothetical protein [Oleiphilaceae bacterium]